MEEDFGGVHYLPVVKDPVCMDDPEVVSQLGSVNHLAKSYFNQQPVPPQWSNLCLTFGSAVQAGRTRHELV